MRLLLIALFFLVGCKEEILHDLDEMRANQVKLVLERSGVPADKSRSGTLWNVSVPSGSVTKALLVIENSRVLTRDLNRTQEAASALTQSRSQRARFDERQQAHALEQTLERIPGVLEARVHLKAAEDSVLIRPAGAEKSSGSVFVVTSSNVPALEEQARRIVAGGSGLPPQSLSVVVSVLAAEAPGPEPAAAAAEIRNPAPFRIRLAWQLLAGGLVLCAVVLLRIKLRNTPPVLLPLAPDDGQRGAEPDVPNSGLNGSFSGALQ